MKKLNELIALFIADLGYTLAQKALGSEKRPTLEDIRTGIQAIIGFSTYFEEVFEDDEGKITWPKNGKRGIHTTQFKRLEARVNDALNLMGSINGNELRNAAASIYLERENKESIIPPKAEGDLDFSLITTNAFRDYVAYRTMFPVKMLMSTINNTAGNYNTFNRMSDINADDVRKAINIELRPLEDAYDPAEIDHTGDEAWELDNLMHNANVVRLDTVELEKAQKYQEQAAAWHSWVVALGASDEMEEQVDYTKTSAARFIEQKRKSSPFIGQSHKTA